MKRSWFFACLVVPFLAATQPARYDVLITELMADPTPSVGLPPSEYVELRNVSQQAYNLVGWKLSDGSGTATINQQLLLQPDSFVILCATGAVASFTGLGRTAGLSNFPSLDNEGDLLVLRSAGGMVVHALAYTTDWYDNNLKAAGGWSLEMVDPSNPCGHHNWKASTATQGGTPGQKNAVEGLNPDDQPPGLLRSFCPDSLHIHAFFDEPLDSSLASIPSHYTLDGNTILVAQPEPPLFTAVKLQLVQPLQRGQVYQLRVQQLKDCSGNMLAPEAVARAGLADPVSERDVVINEILFNPKPSSEDYVELLNRSNKVIDLATLYIGSRDGQGGLSNLKKIQTKPYAFFPGDHVVLTTDARALEQSYFVKEPNAVMQLASLPSYPDEEGIVVVTDAAGMVVDEVPYHEDWHFALISETEGIALERIHPGSVSADAGSWHSAASTAGFGTPGYFNSQSRLIGEVNGQLLIQPSIFSPDNDGVEDVVVLNYQFEEGGYVATIIIFDALGFAVRHLARNALLGIKGSFTWDGLSENRKALSNGFYIIHMEIFNIAGRKKQFRQAVALARR